MTSHRIQRLVAWWWAWPGPRVTNTQVKKVELRTVPAGAQGMMGSVPAA